MKTILQRVSFSSVKVDTKTVGQIDQGLCVLAGIAPTDTSDTVDWMANKIVGLRIFSDDNGKMNKSVLDIGGKILLISQFTLLADCNTGRRPSFTGAGNPETAKMLFDTLAKKITSLGVPVQTGIFGADMRVEIINEGPATFILER